MAEDTSGAKRAGLLKAAKFMMAEIKRRAPSERSSQSFFIEESGDGVSITSHDTGTVATERGWRHPLFGDRDRWYGPSGRQRGRKYFVEAGADSALNHAADAFADEYVQVFTRTSPIWEESE